MIYGFGWRKPKRKNREAGNRFPNMRFQRVSAEVRSDATEEIFQGRVMLTDLSPTGVSIFLEEPLVKGETVSLVIDEPQKLFVKGIVAWCLIHNLNTRVISPQTFRYRVRIQFQFDSRQEEDALKIYCVELPG